MPRVSRLMKNHPFVTVVIETEIAAFLAAWGGPLHAVLALIAIPAYILRLTLLLRLQSYVLYLAIILASAAALDRTGAMHRRQ